MKGEGWLELVEILPTTSSSIAIVNDLSFPTNTGNEDDAIHIFHSQNDHNDGNISLASVVLQPSISPNWEEEMDSANDDNNCDLELSRCLLFRLHPMLFYFLYQASLVNMMKKEIQTVESKNEEQPLPQSNIPSNSDSDYLGARVQLAPLPMLEFQAILEIAQQQQLNEQESYWKCRPVKVVKLKKGSVIFLSCVYVEDDDPWSSEKKPKNRIPVEKVVGASLEGRVIKMGAVVLLSTVYGRMIASITKIVDDDKELMEDNQINGATYRLSDDVCGDYLCHINPPPLLSDENGQNALQDEDEASKWEREIPGYEAPLEQIIGILSLQGDPAAASGVILSGCAGVGKSRLASCVASHFSESGHAQKIYFSSVQDLLFQASVEMNLFKNILVPKLRGCKLWVIDDLNLLESEAGDGDETRNNAELMMVQNALIEAMDRFHIRCCILGIAQSEMNLPSELTKSGRLEKSIQMHAPTQLQRINIWKYILSNDTGGRSFVNSTSESDDITLTLASSTAGCVPMDLMRIYRDAQLKVQTRKTEGCESASTLEWEDLREAIKSTVPSQLSELDVIRPNIFDQGMSWKEIHSLCWQNFGGYSLLKKKVYRQVVVPWKFYLQSLDESLNDDVVRNERAWLEPPPGIIFHGKSGTGKSVAAKCLSDSLGLPIIQVRATDILDKWLGGSEALLRSLFMRARTVSPCILFLDEIDAIACNREEDDNNDVSSRILSTLLNEMDGVSSGGQKNRVLVVTCTNRIQSIDSALLRPGRLQEHFHVECPDVSDLEEILRFRMVRIPMDQNLDLRELASKLFILEATGADVEGLCRDAAYAAMRRLKSHDDSIVAVSQIDFESAIAERFRS